MKRVAEGAYVISAVADRNFQFSLNPDVEEVLEMNRLAKERECLHLRQTTVFSGTYGHAAYNICTACTKRLPPGKWW